MNVRPCIKNLAEFFWFINQFALVGEKEVRSKNDRTRTRRVEISVHTEDFILCT